ncbi:hypothetical protein FEM48_Zijuj03G0034500 [Ziziphus jujuba var. spinosa]|uniref:RING-type domain-containing protein n=1 Tax=Ziziphus jujuba var. spinosa TaxID=714518 RepID=A0A978VMX0_ZIZJJ|nr:hypothetical protein FEM48_Zijuj03G0034500 [Ziziphus jujuba var. spinosa]
MSHRSLGGYAYGIGVPIGVLLVILAVILLNYLCKKKRPLPSEPSQGTNNSLHGGDSVGTRQLEGLDEAALGGFPKIIYSHDKLINNSKGDDESSSANSCCCSICLMDFKDKDLLRLLPDCHHRFHLRCVDPWLRLNPTCPVCRNSPLPTHLAEVPPLPLRASQEDRSEAKKQTIVLSDNRAGQSSERYSSLPWHPALFVRDLIFTEVGLLDAAFQCFYTRKRSSVIMVRPQQLSAAPYAQYLEAVLPPWKGDRRV